MNCILKMVSVVNFKLYVFYHNLKRSISPVSCFRKSWVLEDVGVHVLGLHFCCIALAFVLTDVLVMSPY